MLSRTFHRLTLAAVYAASASALEATTIQIVNMNAAGVGFNDPTAVAALPGNPATTRGAQRLAVFQAAADYWETVIDSNVTIKIEAQMIPQAPCDASSGILGSAGPKSAHANFANAPLASTWYVSALADSWSGSDLQIGGGNDIVANFNTKVDGDATCFTGVEWYYGLGGQAAPPGTFDFYRVVQHEIGHGLGVTTLVTLSTGVRCCNANPMADSYMRNLESHSLGITWPSMTDAQRVTSAKSPNNLHWIGPRALALGSLVTAGKDASGHLNMYAPATLAPGSSVAHWTDVTSPNEMMEPFFNSNMRGFVTHGLMRDIGWRVKLIFADDFDFGDTGAWLHTP